MGSGSARSFVAKRPVKSLVKPTRLRRDAALVLLLLVASLSAPGCTKMNEDAVDPHTVDPPELNPDPIQRVQLFVSAPATLNVRLGADYRIGFWLGMMGGGGEYCGPDVDAPRDAPMHPRPGTTVPIDLKWDGRGYRGELYIDRFLPGRCHWRFFALDVLSPVKDAVSLYSEHPVNYNFDTSHSRGIYDQSPDQGADLWCRADPGPEPRGQGQMQCEALFSYLLSPGTVSNELLATVPVDQRDHMAHVAIFPFTKSITLRFHDLEAENRAAIAGALARGDAGKPCPDQAVRIYVDRDGSIVVNGTPVERVDMFGLSQYIRKLHPAPLSACFATALPPGAMPASPGGTVIGAVARLGLPLAAYADSGFVTPARPE